MFAGEFMLFSPYFSLKLFAGGHLGIGIDHEMFEESDTFVSALGGWCFAGNSLEVWIYLENPMLPAVSNFDL